MFLYLSTLIPDEEFERVIISDKSPQFATHKFNWKLFKGIYFSKLVEDSFYIISTRPISDFPRNKNLIIKAQTWVTQFGDFHELFFINYPIIKTVTILIACIFKSMIWGFQTKKKEGVIIDNYQLPYLVSGYLISRIFNTPFIGVLTDPPNMNYKITWESSLKSSFRKLNGNTSNYLIKKFDGVIALTKYLADDFCPNKDQLIIEGISDNYERGDNLTKTEKFVILYSGSLYKVYGIITLIRAFLKLPFPDLELWIFGRGDSEEEIIDFASHDFRIKYFGFKMNEEVQYYQSKANLLINPRPIDLPDSRYSFPSKILEYMQSGTPTLLTRLPGIPQEYDEFVYFSDGYDEISIKNRIIDIYNTGRDELLIKAQKAKKFAESKSVEVQGEKIAQFIHDISKKYSK